MSLEQDTDISLFISLFQFCALSTPQNPSNFWLTSVCSTLWAILHFSLIFVEIGLVFVYRHQTFHHGSTIGTFLDVVQVVAPLFTHMVMLTEAWYGRPLQQQVRRLFNRVHADQRNSRRGDFAVPIIGFVRKLLAKFVVVIAVGIYTEITILSSIGNDKSWLRSWYYRLWSTNVVRIGVLQFIAHIELVAYDLDAIAIELQGIKSVDDKLRKLRILKKRFLDLWLLTSVINDRFKVSILVVITNYFVLLTISLYWMCARLYFNHLNGLFGKLFYLVLTIVSILKMSYDFHSLVYGFYISVSDHVCDDVLMRVLHTKGIHNCNT